jgi:hypothetical protein
MKVICGWCGKETEIKGISDETGYGVSVCSNCNRLIPSSKIIRENGKHIHMNFKEGDVA